MSGKLTETFLDLVRLEIHLWDRVEEALRAECNTTLGRVQALLAVRRLGPCRVQDVSRELSITVGGASKLVDRLEAAGYCVRRANPDDGRSFLIGLTKAAEPLLVCAEETIETALQEVLGAHVAAADLDRFAAQVSHFRQVTEPEVPKASEPDSKG